MTAPLKDPAKNARKLMKKTGFTDW